MTYELNGEPFNEFVCRILRRVFPGRPVLVLSPMAIELGGRECRLVDLWRAVRQDQDMAKEIVEHYFRCLVEGDEEGYRTLSVAPFAAIRHRIMPRIQPLAMFGGVNPDRLAHVPFVNDTVVLFVVDFPHVTVSIRTEELVRWGVDPEELEGIARENLSRYLPRMEVKIVKGSEGGRAALISAHDGYDAARILLNRLYEKLSPELGNDFFVAIPIRDMFLAFTAEPKPFVHRIQERVYNDAARLPYPITPRLFLMTRDGVAGTEAE